MVPSLAVAGWLVAILAARVDGQGVVRWRGSGAAVGSLCPIRAVTGRRCPGCGMTRACLLLSHGHALRATAMHPAVWLWLALLARHTWSQYVRRMSGGVTPEPVTDSDRFAAPTSSVVSDEARSELRSQS
jgi:hypothetical protein